MSILYNKLISVFLTKISVSVTPYFLVDMQNNKISKIKTSYFINVADVAIFLAYLVEDEEECILCRAKRPEVERWAVLG